MVLAWVVAEWETFITNEHIIKRGYEDIINKLRNLNVNIEEIN